jgi:hypothetical protein
VGELPADLLPGDLRLVRSRETGGPNGVRRGAKRVRAHVADGYSLTCGSGGRDGYGGVHLADRYASNEPTANLRGGVQLSSGVRPSAGDASTRAFVGRGFGLKPPEDALCAIGGPYGDKTPVSLAERLRRSHPQRAYVTDQPSCHLWAQLHRAGSISRVVRE